MLDSTTLSSRSDSTMVRRSSSSWEVAGTGSSLVVELGHGEEEPVLLGCGFHGEQR